MVTHPSTCFGANYSVASFKTWSTSIFYPEMGIMSVREGSKNYYLLSKENILNGRRQTAPNPISPQRHAISSTWLVEKYPTHPYCFTMIWWPEVVGCTRNKYIVRSPIPALKRRDDSNIATSVNSGVPSSQSWSESIYNPPATRDPRRLLPRFKMNWSMCTQIAPQLISPNDKPLNSHMVGLEHTVHLHTSTMIGW